MKITIEQLVQGRPQVVDYYVLAVTHWQEILNEVDVFDTKALAERLSHEQFWFEQHCGGRSLGQEVMAVSGIAQFYSTLEGFGDNREKAQAIADAFAGSFCSLEVKAWAEESARVYDLEVRN